MPHKLLQSTARVAVLGSILALSGSANASVILNYFVQPYTDTTISTCLPDSAPTLNCAFGSVGAFSSSLNLSPGVPVTTVLFPLTITVPANWAYAGQAAAVLPVVDFRYQDTISGATGTLEGAVRVDYEALGVGPSACAAISPEECGVYVFQVFGPDHFRDRAFSLEINPFNQFLGSPIEGGTVTLDVNATFTTPQPIPEPATAILILGAALFAAIVVQRRRTVA